VTLKFGDVVVAAGGPYTSKPRPVVVFQNFAFPTGKSVVVIPLTSQDNPNVHYRVAVKPSSGNGLDRDCWLEVDKVSALRTSWIGPTIGTLEPGILKQADALARKLMSP